MYVSPDCITIDINVREAILQTSPGGEMEEGGEVSATFFHSLTHRIKQPPALLPFEFTLQSSEWKYKYEELPSSVEIVQ